MKKYLYFIFPIYFAVRAIILAGDGNFNFGFYLRVILFILTLYWSLKEFKKL